MKSNSQMKLLPKDEFLESLRVLNKEYPEYRNILSFLIDSLEKGKETEVQDKLRAFIDSDDW